MGVFELFQDHLWMLHPAKLEEIDRFVLAKLRGESIDLEAIKKASKSGNRAEDTYRVMNDVAVIPVYGVLSKRANMLTDFSGGTSYEILQRDVSRAMTDGSVKGILFDVDSPGGSVAGAFETVDAIRSFKGKKPIVAYANGQMASAAYLVGSTVDQIVSYPSSLVGSIGVVMTHYDMSGQDAQRGVKRSFITSGKYKAIANDAGPLSGDGRAYLQSLIDSTHNLLVGAIARNRGVSAQQISGVADGAQYLTGQAHALGLVDIIGSFDDALSLARGEKVQGISPSKGGNGGRNMNTDTTDFWSHVERFQAEGMTRAAAVTSAVKRFPESHKEWLDGIRRGKSRQTSPGAAQQAFMSAVQAYAEKHQCSRAQAVTAVVGAQPALHQAMLDDIRKR